MKVKLFFGFTVFFMFAMPSLYGQSFDLGHYQLYLQNNEELTASQILNRYQNTQPFYKGKTEQTALHSVAYLDSIAASYKLTAAERELLKQNHFVVTERLNFANIDHALHDIYKNDLPVFVTTDALLYALHYSYDKILKDVEVVLISAKLEKILDALYDALPQLEDNYKNQPALEDALADVDLYITIAKSLWDESLPAPQFSFTSMTREIWQAIENETKVEMPLFSERPRKLDFSQFTVRGHYSDIYWNENGKQVSLEPYFKTMMWLGRMDFMLTPPPVNPWERPWTREEIQRMNLGAVLLNELIHISGARPLLQEIDTILTFMVNESDNLTAEELDAVIAEMGIDAADLLDDSIYDRFQSALMSGERYGQKILSSILLMDPYNPEPGELPISFRLLGQRFVIDSYIFSSVVFDRITYNGDKVWRPLPDPLDALFVLGNDAALPLLQQELEKYHYASELDALRYLVDAYDPSFWQQSLYNVWLDAIRALKPFKERSAHPYFMQTAAWQQQKLNTQLASWAHLRHDNLLYAKQSYTGGTACSFPHSFVEPYPQFYRILGEFAARAADFFAQRPENHWLLPRMVEFFKTMQPLALKLEALAQKELDGEQFSGAEIAWLKQMLFYELGSGAPPFSGWYSDLYYRLGEYNQPNYDGSDYVIADVHTQPTTRSGTDIGRILHVGVGEINLGIFIASAPSAGYSDMAYVGPVMSYYEKITENWDRLTDERWANLVKEGNTPQRPDWVNSYLVDAKGEARTKGRELPGILLTRVSDTPSLVGDYELMQNYPNPFNALTSIVYTLESGGKVELTIFDNLGRIVETLVDQHQSASSYTVEWNAHRYASGIYFARLQSPSGVHIIKLVLLQ
ncbi:DUF3160 domain-containing protein [candidate division KSB1 bacterium]|nr:DUF3160 domain-containing protein [candidate division KSB1 bacterium]